METSTGEISAFFFFFLNDMYFIVTRAQRVFLRTETKFFTRDNFSLSRDRRHARPTVVIEDGKRKVGKKLQSLLSERKRARIAHRRECTRDNRYVSLSSRAAPIGVEQQPSRTSISLSRAATRGHTEHHRVISFS